MAAAIQRNEKLSASASAKEKRKENNGGEKWRMKSNHRNSAMKAITIKRRRQRKPAYKRSICAISDIKERESVSKKSWRHHWYQSLRQNHHHRHHHHLIAQLWLCGAMTRKSRQHLPASSWQYQHPACGIMHHRKRHNGEKYRSAIWPASASAVARNRKRFMAA